MDRAHMARGHLESLEEFEERKAQERQARIDRFAKGAAAIASRGALVNGPAGLRDQFELSFDDSPEGLDAARQRLLDQMRRS